MTICIEVHYVIIFNMQIYAIEHKLIIEQMHTTSAVYLQLASIYCIFYYQANILPLHFTSYNAIKSIMQLVHSP